MNSHNMSAYNNHNNSYQRGISSTSQIQNMSTIVRGMNLPCRYHSDQICQNYCIEPKCFKVLCAECIEEHLLHHKKEGLNDLYVKSFKSVRCDCSLKLSKLIQKLTQKLSLLEQPRRPEDLIDEVDNKLQTIRHQMHEIIDQQFMKIKEAIKGKVQESFSTISDLTNIHENLLKVIKQLKEHNTVITEGVMEQHVNVTDSIEKTILLKEPVLFEMFDKEAFEYENKLRKIDMEVLYNQSIFKQGLIDSLKLGGGKNSNATSSRVNMVTRDENGNGYGSRHNTSRSRSRSPINDRNIDKDRSRYQNYGHQESQNVRFPVVHYFESCSNNLHLIDLKNGDKSPHHIVKNLDDFMVPNFHASMLSQKTGAILISGGNIELVEEPAKSHIMSKYSLVSNDFKREYAKVKPRSSHTLCEDYNQEYVYILGGYGLQEHPEEDESVSTFENSVQRVNLRDGSIEEVRSSNWGGANIAVMVRDHILKACMEGIQIYDCSSNSWTKVHNIQSPVSYSQKVFCRGAGYGLISSNTMIIYGGYDEEEEGRKDCFAVNFNLSSFSNKEASVQIKQIDANLPVAEGFWNNPGLIVHGGMYALQNTENSDGEPLESQRRLLKFNLSESRWSNVKMNRK